MTKFVHPSALKHGVFSDILILPGENPEDFERLKAALIVEFKPTGVSEKAAVKAIAKAMWQECRLEVYQRLGAIRARAAHAHRMSDPRLKQYANMERSLANESPIATGLNVSLDQDDQNNNTGRTPVDALLDFGEFLSSSWLTRDLDLESKVQSKIERSIRRLFQLKAMKQMAGLTAPEAAKATEIAPSP